MMVQQLVCKLSSGLEVSSSFPAGDGAERNPPQGRKSLCFEELKVSSQSKRHKIDPLYAMNQS